MENGKEELYNEQKMACVHKKAARLKPKKIYESME